MRTTRMTLSPRFFPGRPILKAKAFGCDLHQLRALETYWYLRLVKGTPHIFDLYQEFFPAKDDPDAMLKALGIPDAAFKESKYDFRISGQAFGPK